MTKKTELVVSTGSSPDVRGYEVVLADVARLLESARCAAARSVNAVMTATYWEIGRRVIEYEQGGRTRAGYGETLLVRLSVDLTGRFGRGFSVDRLETMRRFYLAYPDPTNSATASRKSGRSNSATASRTSGIAELATRFPLPWSHYVRLLAVRNVMAREFYETEALRGGWTVRQLDRQIGSQFYERTALSRNKAAMLRKGQIRRQNDVVAPEEEIKDPFVLEFLNLKDEYSETELEAALIARLEQFLLELGGDFTFVGRQRRLRVGDSWFRIDLLFFHRRLRCLVIIDLKLDKLTAGDAGQMNLYVNYAREHWTLPDENPPVGLILCAGQDSSVAQYALGGMTNKILAAEYRTALPDEKLLAEELRRSRKRLEARPARRADGGAGADRVRQPADGAYEMNAKKKDR
jgi:predicted nuclease of restriction endonuclease-like (RecB) superfamily